MYANPKFEAHFQTPTYNQSKFFVFRDVTIENKNNVIHWHDEIEFLLCVENEVGVYYDSDVVKMQKGDTIIVNSKRLHYVAPEDGMHCYCLIVDKNFFRENAIDISNLEFDRKINDKESGRLMCNVVDAVVNGIGKFETAKKRQTILTYILYMCEKYSHNKTKDYTHDSKAYVAVRDAIEYIDENFSKKITLESIAKRFNYSKYHFARLFKESTSYTLLEHITKKRVEYACKLLRDESSKKSLTQICEECGFASYSYFSKCFKDEYGVLPSDVRKNK